MTREFSWSNQDFKVQNASETVLFELKTKVAHKLAGYFKMSMNDTQQKTNYTIKVNTGHVWCGFKQTYKISNGVQFEADPRYFLSDQWRIKKSGNITDKYTWHRGATSLSGYVKNSSHKKVAYLAAAYLGSEILGSFSHSTFPTASTYTILSNGDIPAVTLVALYASAIVRMDRCSY